MVPARIPLLAGGNPSNYLLDLGPGLENDPCQVTEEPRPGGGEVSWWRHTATSREPRPSKHTIRVGEQRRERERDATAVRWARAVTGPLGLSLPTQGQTRDTDSEMERQLAELWQDAVITDSDILASDTRWEVLGEVQEYKAPSGGGGPCMTGSQARHPQPGPSLQRLPWTEPRSEPVTRWGPSWHVKFKVHNSHSQISNIVRCTLIVVRI